MGVGGRAIDGSHLEAELPPHVGGCGVELGNVGVDGHVDDALPTPLIDDDVEVGQIRLAVAAGDDGDADDPVAGSGTLLRDRVELPLRGVREVRPSTRRAEAGGTRAGSPEPSRRQARVAHDHRAVASRHQEHADVVIGGISQEDDPPLELPREGGEEFLAGRHGALEVAAQDCWCDEGSLVVGHEVPAVEVEGASFARQAVPERAGEVVADAAVPRALGPEVRHFLGAGRQQCGRRPAARRPQGKPAVARPARHRVPREHGEAPAGDRPDAAHQVVECGAVGARHPHRDIAGKLAEKLAIGLLHDRRRRGDVVDHELADRAVAVGEERPGLPGRPFAVVPIADGQDPPGQAGAEDDADDPRPGAQRWPPCVETWKGSSVTGSVPAWFGLPGPGTATGRVTTAALST